MNKPIQDGYRINAQGHLVPEESIQPIDLLRDDTVCRLFADAIDMQQQMLSFKDKTMADISAFLDISADQYGVKMGGKKGNITLSSFDGSLRITIAVSDTLSFDERIGIAKTLVDKCINAWAKDVNVNIKALVQHAFQTDKQGKISTGRIFGLMRLKIDDDMWQQAMKALKDSIKVDGSCAYLRFHKKTTDQNGKEKWEQVSLDMAGL